MECSVSHGENCQVELKFNVPPEEYSSFYKDAIKKVKRDAKLPGFRKGHIPDSMLKSKFAYTIRETFLDDYLPNLLFTQIQNEKLEIISHPEISQIDFEPDKPLVFSAKVEVQPEVKADGYKGIELTRKTTVFSDDDVDGLILDYRNHFATYEEVKIRPSQEGDRVVADLEVMFDNNDRIGGLSGQTLVLEKHGTFFDSLIEGLTGVNAGDKKVVTLEFPDNHPREEYRNRKVTVTATVKRVEEKVLPELNDEFVKKISKFETVAEFREDVRKRLEMNAAESDEEKLRSQLRDKLLETCGSFSAPPSLIESRTQFLLQRFETKLERNQQTLDSYLAETGLSREQLDAELRNQAEKLVKLDFIYYNIASSENIRVTELEIEAEIRRLADQYNESPERLKRRFDKSDITGQIRFDLLQDKVVNFVLEHADIKVEEVEFEREGEN